MTTSRPVREPNLRLQQLIEEAGFSHKGLARRVNDLGKTRGLATLTYDHSSVARWLKGEQPRHPVSAIIAEVFSTNFSRIIEPSDLGFPPTEMVPDLGLQFSRSWPEAVEAITTLWRSDLERRQFIVDSTFAVGAYASSAVRWLTAPPTQVRLPATPTRQVGHYEIEAIREITQTFVRLDNLFGGGRARPTVVRYLHDEVTPLLQYGRYSEATGRELFVAAAELTRLAGWMAYDLEEHGLAQRYLIQALRLASEAKDHALGSEILAGMSHQAVYLGKPDDALDLARAAQDAASKGGLPSLVAEALVMQAHAFALARESSACTSMLNAAERQFVRAGSTEKPAWHSYFDDAYMAAKFGHCFLELGDGHRAEHFARQSLDMVDGFLRGRAFNTVLLASAHLRQANIDEACAVGGQALDLSSTLQSGRTIKYMRDFRRRLDKSGAHASVTEFQDRAQDVLPASDPNQTVKGRAA